MIILIFPCIGGLRELRAIDRPADLEDTMAALLAHLGCTRDEATVHATTDVDGTPIQMVVGPDVLGPAVVLSYDDMIPDDLLGSIQ